MLSRQCLDRNRELIPKLVDDHGALLYGDKTLVDLSTAEHRLLMPCLAAQLGSTLRTLPWSCTELAYSEGIGGCPKVRQLIADLANDYFNPRHKVDKSHIVLGAGGCFALSALIGEICDPADGILIAAPYWPGLDLAISVRNEAKAVIVQIPFEEFFEVDSIKYYQDALDTSTAPIKAVLICNPHNPLAGNYPRETLQATLDFCARNNLHLISDEVYALSQHTSIDNTKNDPCPGPGFVSALALDTTTAKGLVHVLYSLSKDFGCNGVRIGAFISQENREVVMSGALSTHCQTSSMATFISEKVILTKENIHFVNSRGRDLLQSAYGVIQGFLQANRIEYVPADSGMYIFAKLCPVETMEAEKFFRQILKDHALVISAGTDYHLSTPGWFRICYACEPEKLTDGLKRIGSCINEFKETYD
ncbi:hypothetical protein MY4038_009721 [Beauveria bassiana]